MQFATALQIIYPQSLAALSQLLSELVWCFVCSMRAGQLKKPAPLSAARPKAQNATSQFGDSCPSFLCFVVKKLGEKLKTQLEVLWAQAQNNPTVKHQKVSRLVRIPLCPAGKGTRSEIQIIVFSFHSLPDSHWCGYPCLEHCYMYLPSQC